MNIVKIWIFIFYFLISASAQADNQSIIYQGRVLRPDGAAPNSGVIAFTLSIYSPLPSKCLLYSENQSVNMAGANGLFSLELGAGSRVDGGAHSLNNVFVNGGSLTGLTCATGSSYSPSSKDDRELRVSFNDGGVVVNLAPMSIKSVPFALQAHEIDGWGINNLVKVSGVGSPTTFTTAEMVVAKTIAGLTCGNNEIIKWNGTTWACAPDATGGSSGDSGYGAANKGLVAFNTDAATSGIAVVSGVASVNSGTGANQIVKLSGAARLPAVDGSALTSLNADNISAGTLPIARGGTGATSFAANSLVMADGTGGAFIEKTCASTEILKWNGTAWACAADATGTAGVGGSGTVNSLPRFTAGTTLGDSGLSDDGTLISASRSVSVASGSNYQIGGAAVLRVSNTSSLSIGIGANNASTAAGNTAVGYDAHKNNGTGTDNTAFGHSAGSAALSGSNRNTFMGSQSFTSNTTGGFDNTVIGYYAGPKNGTGASFYNTYLGSNAGNGSFPGGSNTFIGYASGSAAPAAIGNATAIGANSQVDASNSLVLGASGVNVGLSEVTIPTSKLDFTGAMTVRGIAVPAVSSAGQGRIYFDSTEHKFKVSQHGGAYMDLVGGAAVANATTVADFSAGNIQYTNDSCQGFDLHYLQDGASYMFVVKGGAAATCSFNAFSDAGGTALVVHLPPDHAASTAGTHTVYNFVVVGADVYVAWTPGY